MNGRYTCFMLQASNTIQANGIYHNATSIKCSFTNVRHRTLCTVYCTLFR